MVTLRFFGTRENDKFTQANSHTSPLRQAEAEPAKSPSRKG